MSIIGIDLGSSNICIAKWQRSISTVLENDFYNTITPNFLSYKKNNNILFGKKAKDDSIRNMNNTVFDIKRINNENKRNELPFLEPDGSFKIVKNNQKLDLASFYKDLFIKIKEMYFKNINNIDSLVVALPEEIYKIEGKIIKNAAKEANLEIKKFIDDKIPIIYMYQLNNQFHLNETIVIIDIGGSKTEICLVNINNYEYIIDDYMIDENLGGRDFDKKLLKYMIEKLEEQENIKIKGKLERNLELECEKTKIGLSSGNAVFLEYNYIYEEEDRTANYEVEREVFENLCKDLFTQFENLIKNFMKQYNNKKINQVILMGGTSRMPKIKEIISSIFGEKKMNYTLNPDETIAKGASLYASMISDEEVDDDLINLKVAIKRNWTVIKKRDFEEYNEKTQSIKLKNSNTKKRQKTKSCYS